MSLEVHHLHLSQSERIVWLLEEMQVPYKLVVHERNPTTGVSPQSLKDVTKAGTAPFIIDTTRDPPAHLSESGAIVQYILDVYGPSAPGTRLDRQPSDADYVSYVAWLHYANGTLQPSFSRSLALVSSGGIESPTGKNYVGRLRGQLESIEDRLSSNKWLAGAELTTADVMTVFSLTTMRGFVPVDLSPYSNILRYLKDVAARPAYLEALRKGDGGMEPMIKPVERRFTHFESFKKVIENIKPVL